MLASLVPMAVCNYCEWENDAWLVYIVPDLLGGFTFSNKTDFREWIDSEVCGQQLCQKSSGWSFA
jgi:hypothetical protein